MTRINSGIKPDELCDQHLVAEYRELPRVGTMLVKRLEKGADLTAGTPDAFTLGTGHMAFFIDKGEYLRKRFESLKQEMIDRGMNPTMNWRDQWASVPDLCNDWSPDGRVRAILQARIEAKMPKKPRFSRRNWSGC
jgi:hypothetical protein